MVNNANSVKGENPVKDIICYYSNKSFRYCWNNVNIQACSQNDNTYLNNMKTTDDKTFKDRVQNLLYAGIKDSAGWTNPRCPPNYEVDNSRESTDFQRCGGTYPNYYGTRCTLKYYNMQDNPVEMAECQMGRIDDTTVLSKEHIIWKGVNHITKKSKCPPNLNTVEDKDMIMGEFCNKWDYVDSNMCIDYFESNDANRIKRDNVYINICMKDEYKDHPKCSCINAKPPADIPVKIGWLFSERCHDPIYKAFKTENMKNITWQDCRQYWDVKNSSNVEISNNQMEQTCIMNFPAEGGPGPGQEAQKPPEQMEQKSGANFNNDSAGITGTEQAATQPVQTAATTDRTLFGIVLSQEMYYIVIIAAIFLIVMIMRQMGGG